jgi:hypothetical protein
MRLVVALVGLAMSFALPAAAFSNGRCRAEKEGFLRWLESLDAPEILAPIAVLGRSGLVNYLPDNDNH